MTDRFELRNLECAGRHGAYAGEQDRTRIFLVDVSPRTRHDAPIANMDALAAAVCTAVGGSSRQLLERVAFDVADAVLTGWDQIDTVWVRVTKPDPPGLDAAAEAVALRLSREQLRAGRRSSARHERKAGRRGRE